MFIIYETVFRKSKEITIMGFVRILDYGANSKAHCEDSSSIYNRLAGTNLGQPSNLLFEPALLYEKLLQNIYEK